MGTVRVVEAVDAMAAVTRGLWAELVRRDHMASGVRGRKSGITPCIGVGGGGRDGGLQLDEGKGLRRKSAMGAWAGAGTE